MICFASADFITKFNKRKGVRTYCNPYCYDCRNNCFSIEGPSLFMIIHDIILFLDEENRNYSCRSAQYAFEDLIGFRLHASENKVILYWPMIPFCEEKRGVYN